MTTKPRTIDNLGVETSSRYARDKAALDTKLIEESRFIPLKTEVSVVKPYLPTEFEEYLMPDKRTMWALFAPPPDSLVPSKALFSYQLIPSLGGYEKQETDTDKLEALDQSDRDGQQEEEKERKTVLALLLLVGKLDRALTLINSRRNQYQRG
jgi:hypothetical protein